jgi:hypothetical protein
LPRALETPVPQHNAAFVRKLTTLKGAPQTSRVWRHSQITWDLLPRRHLDS